MAKIRVKKRRGIRWISATVNETYTSDRSEGIRGLTEGDTVILESDGTWYKG